MMLPVGCADDLNLHSNMLRGCESGGRLGFGELARVLNLKLPGMSRPVGTDKICVQSLSGPANLKGKSLRLTTCVWPYVTNSVLAGLCIVARCRVFTALAVTETLRATLFEFNSLITAVVSIRIALQAACAFLSTLAPKVLFNRGWVETQRVRKIRGLQCSCNAHFSGSG
jgi:hypothetical protein